MALTRDELIRFSKNDERVLQLAGWLESVGSNLSSIEFASEDASFRRYFRVGNNESSFVAMDAPADLEEFEKFIRIAKKFKQVGLNVPEILAADHENGFALMTDFGNTTYLEQLSRANADSLYEDAIDSLVLLQQATHTDVEFLPPYNCELIVSEMELFREWYLKCHLQKAVSPAISDVLDHTFEILREKAAEQPKVWVHRDYHSRNLMVVQNNNPGILDFQDAVYGPVSYDLVSLLRDCYVVWDQETVDQWIRLYLNKARQAGVVFDFDQGQFIEWFDWIGIQRHIKVAGIFSRLNYRDKKSKFLEDIPTVMAYIESVSKKYPELQDLRELVTKLTKTN